MCYLYDLWFVSYISQLILTAGTFWIVQGGGQMPFFATGMNYSPTGNSFEGMQTEAYAATIGTSLPNYLIFP